MNIMMTLPHQKPAQIHHQELVEAYDEAASSNSSEEVKTRKTARRSSFWKTVSLSNKEENLEQLRAVLEIDHC